LQYKLVKALSSGDIDTVAKADAITSADLVMDWTPNITSTMVSGLNVTTTYYFAVLVKDEAENKALYLNPDWQTVGTEGFSDVATGPGGTQYLSLALDSNDVPYVVGVDNNYKAKVMKFDGTSWITLGNTNLWFSQGALALDHDNVPYVGGSFSEGGSTRGTIMKFDGTSWVTVGDPFSTSEYVIPSLALDSNNVLYAAIANGSGDGKVKKFDTETSSWVNVGDPVSRVYYSTLVLDSNDVAYVDGDTVVNKFNGTNWVPVGDPIYYLSSGGSLALDSNNVLYSSGIDTTHGSPYKGIVNKFDGTNWVSVGDSLTYPNRLFLALDHQNVPYVVGTNNDMNDGTVKKFNGTNWVTVGTEVVSAGRVRGIALALDSNNIPYVFSVGDEGTATVKKLGGSVLVPSFTTGFDIKDITAFSILDNAGIIKDTNIAVVVPVGTPVTNLTPTIEITGSSVSPASEAAQDFTNPVPYTVTGLGGTPKVYTVTVYPNGGSAGGWRFYDKGSYSGSPSWRYLEATLVNQSASIGQAWSTTYSLIGTGTDIGTGQANTAAIITQLGQENTAAKLCDDLVVSNGGADYDDWFLPSISELDQMYAGFSPCGICQLAGSNYWSSSEYSENEALILRPNSGNPHDHYYKPNGMFVRCVRAY